jgi:hypothetical protein
MESSLFKYEEHLSNKWN